MAITGRIYRIRNSEDDKIYIGSTITSLRKRWYTHKSCARHNHNKPLSRHMAAVGIHNFVMELVKKVIVEDIDVLRQLEQEECDKYDKEQLLNRNRAFAAPRGSDRKIYDRLYERHYRDREHRREYLRKYRLRKKKEKQNNNQY